MASWPPKKNAAFVFYVGLVSQADTKLLQASPTLAADDVKVATDDAAPGNLATLPVVDADFTDRVKVSLSAGEMNGDRITVIFSDAAGAEWADLLIDIPTTTRQIDDLAFPATSGRSFTVETDGMVHGDLKEWLGVAPLALVAQRVNSSVGAMAAAVLTAAAIASNAFTAVKFAASALNGKGDWNIGKTGYSLAATGLDAIASTALGMIEIAKAVADRVLTGATHNIPDSLGRRVRDLQEFGTYEGGAVWIQTSGGTAGTTDFENGTNFHPVDSIADANTIAASVLLVRFEVAPGSSITFPGAQTDEKWEGRDWTLILNGKDITGSFIFGAIVTGVGIATGTYEFEECDIGAVTLDNDGHFERCALTDTFTLGQAGTFTFHQCFTEAAGTITIDFGALGATAVHLLDFHGQVNFKNMATGDTVHITGGGTITTETCTAGTITRSESFRYTDAGGNVTEVKTDIEDVVGVILPKKNVALNDIPFDMVLSSDHSTAAIGKTVTVTRSIDGDSTFDATTGTFTEAENGLYHFDASAEDMNGALVTFKFSAPDSDDTKVSIRTGG